MVCQSPWRFVRHETFSLPAISRSSITNEAVLPALPYPRAMAVRSPCSVQCMPSCSAYGVQRAAMRRDAVRREAARVGGGAELHSGASRGLTQQHSLYVFSCVRKLTTHIKQLQTRRLQVVVLRVIKGWVLG